MKNDEISCDTVEKFQTSLINILKRNGYKSKGLTAYKEYPEIVVLITIQNESRWQYINVGIQFLNFENEIPKNAYSAHLRSRLDGLLKSFKKEIWEVSDKKRINETVSTFLNCFENKMVKELERFNNEGLVKKYFNDKLWEKVLSSPEVRSYLL